ncbi:right-handed parallel beta-helix repeat-containing protein [Candidatus Harpocratesius sp.]
MSFSKRNYHFIGIYLLLVISGVLVLGPNLNQEPNHSAFLPIENNSEKIRPNRIVNETITLRGNESLADYPFITGTGTPSDPYLIEGITLRGDYVYSTSLSLNDERNISSGIVIQDAVNSYLFKNCVIEHFNFGIRSLYISSNLEQKIRVENCMITNCSIGFYSEATVRIEFVNNQFIDCQRNNQLPLEPIITKYNRLDLHGPGVAAVINHLTKFAIFEDNVVKNCGMGLFFAGKQGNIINNSFYNCGLWSYFMYSYGYEITGNTVNDLPLGFFFDEDNVNLNGNIQNYGQVIAIGCNNLQIHNMKFTDTFVGLYCSQSNNLSIEDITIENCHIGIIIEDQSNILMVDKDLILKNVIIKNCYVGSYLDINYADQSDLIAEIEITSFDSNTYDVILNPFSIQSGYKLAVPIGSLLYIDNDVNIREVVEEISFSDSSFTTVSYVESIAHFMNSSQICWFPTEYLNDVKAIEINIDNSGETRLTISQKAIDYYYNQSRIRIKVDIVLVGIENSGFITISGFSESLLAGSLFGISSIILFRLKKHV